MWPWTRSDARYEADQPAQSHVDLSVLPEVTTALLAHPLDWRVRVVEQVDLVAATSCTRRRSLQSAPLRPLLPATVPRGASTALVILNVASIPRGALVQLDIAGPDDSPAFLVPRAELARREALYLSSLAEELGFPVSGPLLNLMAATLGHTRTSWERPKDSEALLDVGGYLEDGFGQAPPAGALRVWQKLDQQVFDLLSPHADDNTGLSPCEHPIVALPDLVAEVDLDKPGWPDYFTRALTDYCDLLQTATSAAETAGPSAAGDLLASWADYGRNYDMLIATTVPLDEPFTIKYSESRLLTIDSSGHGSQDLVISDAVSNHVLLTVADPNVVVSNVTARQSGQQAPAYGALSVRRNQQSYAIYAHDQDRSYRVSLDFTLSPLRRLNVATAVTTALLLLATLGIVYEQPRRLSELAIVIGLSALALGSLTTREASSLSARLRRRGTLVLALASLLLITTATLTYLWTPLTALVAMVHQ